MWTHCVRLFPHRPCKDILAFDVIRNILEKYFNYNVTLVMNITDIDDKIINKSKELGIKPSELTEKFTEDFLDDMKLLNVRRPSVITKVTDYIENIKEFINKLVENQFAYESNGSYYFDIEAYRSKYEYPIFKTKTESITSNNDKKATEDFALWKKSSDFGYQYNSSFGRPGWHIECSVMCNDVLGKHIDIHAGGIDLKFPHHENEIAQCQAFYNDKPWVNYFLHTGHLNINGLKMSKSLKNFTTIKSILQRCTPVQLRILFLYHHWNKDMNYEEDQIKFAINVEKKLFNFVMYVDSLINYDTKNESCDVEALPNIKELANEFDNMKLQTESDVLDKESETKSTTSEGMEIEYKTSLLLNNDREILQKIVETSEIVGAAFCNNFDTSTVIKALIELISFANTKIKVSSINALVHAKDYLLRVLDILGISQQKKVESKNSDALAEVVNGFRNKIRAFLKKGSNKNDLYTYCDEVRVQLHELGYVIEDAASGSIIKKN